MDITSPAVEILIHKNRLEDEREFRYIRGAIRGALIEAGTTKFHGRTFVTVCTHGDSNVVLADNEMMTLTELESETFASPVVLITLVD